MRNGNDGYTLMISEQEFRGLYKQYEKLVRATIFYLARPNELDEIVQETFIKIWRGAHNFKNRAALSTWIYRISYNSAIDALRRKNEKIDQNIEEVDEIKKLERRDLIDKALKRLEKEDQEIIKLCYFVELTTEEIGQMLEIPEGTVKSRLHYAKERLEKILNEWGVLYE